MPKQDVKNFVYGFLDFAATVCRPINPNCRDLRSKARVQAVRIKVIDYVIVAGRARGDQVDLIAANLPFGGQEKRGILANFPDDK